MSHERQSILNGVFYALLHLDSLEPVKANRFAYNIFPNFKDRYDEELQHKTLAAIRWALAQDDIDSCCSLEDVPFDGAFKREYLNILLGHLLDVRVSA